MTQEILRHMNLKLKELLPYQFYEWRTKAEYPYWIGEYSETPDTSEDGSGEDVMMVTGTTKGSVMDLENGKEVLQKALTYFGVILVFGVGAGLGSILTAAVGCKAIWVCCALLSISFGLMFVPERK